MNIEKVTLGAGCFWCIETIFLRIKGVVEVISGYADGDTINPTYQQVISGNTNHAEVIQVSYDPETISFEQLLSVFFAIHDPTTLNRQGYDVGSQYRSTIIYHTDEQKRIAQEKIATLNSSEEFPEAIVTHITAYTEFYCAESYHQDYYNNNSDTQYCQLVVSQKIQKFLNEFSHLLKE